MAIGAAALVALAAASGNFELPVVAGDARAGLSADGRTAVLVEQPAHGRSRFALVDRDARRVERVIAMRGDYGFDAVSPDASRIYVIRYESRDRRRYAVQAMRVDDPSARLETVVEKGEPGERMSGLPIARATSGGSGWIYTLYDGGGSTPFVHALQTQQEFTVCIDLHALEGRRDLGSLKLELRGAILTVTDATRTPLVRVNTDSFDVTAAEDGAKPTRTKASATNKAGSGTSDEVAAGVAVAAALMTAWLLRRPQRTGRKAGKTQEI